MSARGAVGVGPGTAVGLANPLLAHGVISCPPGLRLVHRPGARRAGYAGPLKPIAATRRPNYDLVDLERLRAAVGMDGLTQRYRTARSPELDQATERLFVLSRSTGMFECHARSSSSALRGLLGATAPVRRAGRLAGQDAHAYGGCLDRQAAAEGRAADCRGGAHLVTAGDPAAGRLRLGHQYDPSGVVPDEGLCANRLPLPRHGQEDNGWKARADPWRVLACGSDGYFQ